MATCVSSCSLMTDRLHHTRIFYNLNPATGNHGVLYFEEGPYPYTSPEGMWVAGDTDMDFCLVHGKSHDNRGVYLIPYNGVVNGYIVKNGYFTKEKVQNDMETQSTAQNNTEVQAQSVEEEYVELIMNDQKYRIDKQKLKDLKKAIS